ncbi:DNA primase [Pantoea phage Kyle]|uniref:DNA primase n=1 Tax=Pantoea phage Kyle TaxID=2589665 RepID=A0A514A8T0_9CAUD|nr:DNA primase [Pantoea phage Kyle]QDH49659.1 DNA primase [Pantoea phage Kyle]
MSLREEAEKAEKFLSELTKFIPEDQRAMVVYADEATVQFDANGKKINSVFWPKPWKLGKPIMQQQNCYVCISSMEKTPNPKTGEMRFWRTESAFGCGMAMMVDDIGTGKGSKGELPLESFYNRLPPTVTVETSPDNYQLWYFFTEPCYNLLEFKAYLASFVAQILQKGGDNTIKDVTRVGRMPCGVNNKRNSDNTYKYVGDDGKLWRVRIHDADYSRRYSMEEIRQAFGFTMVLPQKREIEIDEEQYKLDAVWLKIAQRVMTQAKMGEGAGGEAVENMSGKIRCKCPWGHEHSNGDPYGAYFRGPIAGAEHEFVFGCAHDCHRKGEGKKGWTAFVEEVVMPYIENNLDAINRKASGFK